jgi:xylulose-5-phosphate/fructose-6-phosphate phosphoketolase
MRAAGVTLDYVAGVASPGAARSEPTRELGAYLRDVIHDNQDRFRLSGSDTTASNRLNDVFEATDRTWMAETVDGYDHLSPDGRVTEVLSEHMCQAWLEGYLLTGRHGLVKC